jgi:hypothetical protein
MNDDDKRTESRKEVIELCETMNGKMCSIDVFWLEIHEVVIDLSTIHTEYIEREMVEQTYSAGFKDGRNKQLKKIKEALCI